MIYRNILIWAILSAAQAADWKIPARHWAGTSIETVRSASLEELRQIPQLEKKLLEALDSSHEEEAALALDLITELQPQSLVPALKRRGERPEEEGRSFLALAQLSRPENARALRDYFLKRAQAPMEHSLAKVILLDALTTMQGALPLEKLRAWLMSPAESETLQSACLAHLRSFWRRGERRELLGLLSETLRHRRLGLRRQAMTLLRELPPTVKVPGRAAALESCSAQEKDSDLRAACQKLRDGRDA